MALTTRSEALLPMQSLRTPCDLVSTVAELLPTQVGRVQSQWAGAVADGPFGRSVSAFHDH